MAIPAPIRERLLLLVLVSVWLGVCANDISNKPPFFLFGSDVVKTIRLQEPTCLFVASGSNLDLEKFVLTIHRNASLEPWEMTLGELAQFNDGSVAGHLCFDADHDVITIDRGDLYKDMDPTSLEWRSVIMLFVSQNMIKEPCNRINVYGISSEKTPQGIEASADCPAYVLTPTNVKTMHGQASNCPFFYVQDPSLAAKNALVNLTTVQKGGAPTLENPQFASYSSNYNATPILFDRFLRSAVMVTTNQQWHEVLSLQNYNLDTKPYSPLHCTMGNITILQSPVTDMLIDSDPYGPEEFEYLVDVGQGDCTVEFKFAPGYNRECITFTILKFEYDGYSTLVDSTSSMSFNVSDFAALRIGFVREQGAQCQSEAVTLKLSIYPPTTTTPVSTPSSTVAPGLDISPFPPYMLFGSDNVQTIRLKEPMCLFVASGSNLDLEKFFNDGSVAGHLCFDADHEMITVDRGDLYKDMDPTSLEWRSVIMLFVSKNESDICKENVYGIASEQAPQGIKASADCPAYVFTPTNVNTMHGHASNCPYFNVHYASLAAENALINLTTVQRGGSPPLKNPQFASYSSNRDKTPVAFDQFLRSVVMVTTNHDWHEVLSVQNFNLDTTSEAPLHCNMEALTIWQSPVTDLLIDSDPYGPEEFDYYVRVGEAHSIAQFNFVPRYNRKCVNFTILKYDADGKSFAVDSTTSMNFNVTDFEAFRVTFVRKQGATCFATDVSLRLTIYPPLTTTTVIQTSTQSSAVSTGEGQTTSSSSSSTHSPTILISSTLKPTTTAQGTSTKDSDGLYMNVFLTIVMVVVSTLKAF
ncbi:hypothetical protein L596_021460 [Steinernema carpocapsae]|uniref:CUB domain-containing protein n=1 Tax=Steinernema carpocapsae TaxID=34508 RepID=A0A4U5MIW0_STECR|nr:hypothetical protein L596_021460 [Steinernema carpocapsae]